jgi:5-methyltetrahydropteroyltriglutamate--homocysteine methyltransferase
MKKSENRILTTHVGSLPRSDRLLELLVERNSGKAVSQSEIDSQIALGLNHIVAKQHEVGIDIPSDGELPRIGFSFYVKDRMSGFSGVSPRGTITDFAKFPGYARLKLGKDPENLGRTATMYEAPACTGRLTYDPTAAKQELDGFAKALREAGSEAFTETFVTAATPGIISTTLLRDSKNAAYATDRDYVLALADELRKEYELVVAAGHILQIDAPDLLLERQILFDGRPLQEFLQRVDLHIEAINRALVNIPRDRVRLHVCWGNWDGPHADDVDLEPVLPYFYKANVGGLSLACSMPCHAHESKLFRKLPPPKHMILLPGVIDVTTNILEHPEVIADRITQFADIIGDPTRVIASTDCGFSTFAGYVMVPEDVAWVKLRRLVQGARLASERLFR